MRKYHTLVFLLLFTSVISNAQYVTIPDSVFRTRMQQWYPNCFNANGQMDTTCNEILSITDLDCGDWEIANLEGIQYFKGLTYLDCSNNYLSLLPQLPALLTDLNCLENQLIALPVLPNKLLNLDCSGNPNLHCLPKLPTSMIKLYIDTTAIQCLPNKPPSMEVWNFMTKVNTPVCDSPNTNGCNFYKQAYWTGITSAGWEESANWYNGVVPGLETEVIITTGQIVISSDITIKSLQLDPAATLTITTGYKLTILH